MIDMHCHILFDTDDGSKSLEESIEMIKEARNAGFTSLVATPHYLEPQFVNTCSQNIEVLNKIKETLKGQDILVDLYLGNEIYITNKIEDLINGNKVKTLGDSDYIMFELPLFQKLDSAVEIIRNLPYNHMILAHPERYVAVQKDIHYLDDFIEMGVLLQCNYESITGKYGFAAKNIMKKLLKKNMVDLLSTDCHRMHSTYTRMEDVERRLLKVIDKEYYDYLTVVNPQNILNTKEE